MAVSPDGRDTWKPKVALWDNFPVNDFDFTRVFLGPLTGRDTRLDAVPPAGMTANPMVHAAASRLALATVADYAWQPAAYDPARSHERAVRLVPGAAELAPLVEACSSWPPSADQSPALSALCASVLANASRSATRPDGENTLVVGPEGEDTAAVRLRFELERLAALPASTPGRIGEELRPWTAAARDIATTALAALDLVTALPRANGDEVARGPAEAAASRAISETARAVAAALARAEEHEANVLRGVLPPFVRAALNRAAPCRLPRPAIEATPAIAQSPAYPIAP
ncbi:beta-N-acetylglucosaminidase domain-containing protein [Nonomuraea montanisoli]|uniref:beta-N-acetylglucosaminidase domain-containing protein n=1 Tax=Nonomuraea montanisoli TaxID=2741721 RepID=UPI0019631E0C|nr:beta-N-acetylglucosaminidase domain-containing protein [Nonomuraea montanisoli]